MILVRVVFGGMGSVWGVVAGAAVLSLLQSWFLPSLTQWIHALGEAINNDWMQSIDLARSIELIFGIILVVMMLYRRDGLIPATRKQAALTFEAQHVQSVRRGGFEPAAAARVLGELPRGTGNLLEVRGVTVRFGGLTALNKVDVSVPLGGVVAVIGPNGSGKSTLFNVITGLVPAEDGSIRFAGEEILGLRPHQILARGVARTFQNIRLFANLQVIDNVMIGQHARLHTGILGAILRLPGTRKEERAARVRALDIVSLFGNRLAPRLTQVVSALSYANRRRVEIARALATQPKILLLDEPTAGMNPAETLELAEQIASLREQGLTILIIEHKLDVVTRLADTVVVLDHGEKLVEGTPDAVRRNEDVLRAYLGRAATEAAHAA
jgi:branched-chain amino acid transport system permease protein